MLRILSRSFALGAFLLVLTPANVFAHASLISSTPAAGARLAEAPAQIRLVFSEPIEVAMSQVSLVQGQSMIGLSVQADPRNAQVLIANLKSSGAGNYEIRWHVLSADGHAVSGTLRFSAGPSEPPPDKTIQTELPDSPAPVQHTGLTRIAMFLRGVGMSALMAFAGLLFFASGSVDGTKPEYSSLATKILVLAAAALLAHFICWATLSGAGMEGARITDVLQTSAGRREAVRAIFALLALCTWWLARKPGLALVFASGGVLSGAFIGHAAAMDPAVSIAFKLVHLGLATIWMGGLVWILMADGNRPDTFGREVIRVSNAAGWCVLLVFVSGVIQAGIVLSWNPKFLTSSYALVAALKLLGLAALVALGAVNRFRIMPTLGTATVASKLRTNVSRELVVMSVVVLLGGVLSYLSPPDPRGPSSAHSHSRGLLP